MLEHGAAYEVGDTVTVQLEDDPTVVVVDRIVAIVEAEEVD